MTLILSNDDVEKLLTMQECIDVLEDVYVELAAGRAVNRIGATNGLGVKYLARKNAKSVGILGSGWQAGTQLMAACAVRKIETIRCFSPNRDHCAAFAREM